MYNQFCKNLRHFINIINIGESNTNCRKQIAETLLPLTDIEAYKEFKNCNEEKYNEISKLIFDISQYSDKFPALKKFVWELWAYGFDIEIDEDYVFKTNDIDEVARIADLMLSTHYFK